MNTKSWDSIEHVAYAFCVGVLNPKSNLLSAQYICKLYCLTARERKTQIEQLLDKVFPAFRLRLFFIFYSMIQMRLI